MKNSLKLPEYLEIPSRHFRVPKKENIDCTPYQMVHTADIKRYILQPIKRQHQDILDTIKRICCNVSPLAIDSNLLTDDRNIKTFVRNMTTWGQIQYKKSGFQNLYPAIKKVPPKNALLQSAIILRVFVWECPFIVYLGKRSTQN